MSLNKHNAIPVDTHVWQIAQRKYGFSTKTRRKSNSLTFSDYEAVGNHFRKIFGEYSGWAHSVNCLYYFCKFLGLLDLFLKKKKKKKKFLGVIYF
jgi:N-glycosylase/DNA lyase